jgi:uncharacterized protein (TIGR00251 family)
LRLYITVRFSSDDKLIVEGDQVSISIKSAPERGKANRELIKRLAKHFQVPENNIRIVSGLTSRKKIIDIL